MEYSDVAFDPAASGLLTVAEARERLAENEMAGEFTFLTRDPDIDVIYGKGWSEAGLQEAAPVWLRAGGRLFQLTHQAAQQLGSTAKVNKRFQVFIPPEKLSDLVTWALQEGLHKKNGDGTELKLLLSGTGEPGPFLPGPGNEDQAVPLAVAQTRGTVSPFGNVRLFDTVLLAIRAKLGNEIADRVAVDDLLFDDREHTSWRFIIPGVQQLVGEDAWCYGIEVTNSATGARQLTIAGYMFSFATLSGIPDLESEVGGFKRRGSTPAAAYAWAAEAAELVLDGPESAFGALRELAESDVDAEYGSVLEQYFRASPVSADLKLAILAGLDGCLDPVTTLTLATVASAETNAAGCSWRDAASLLALAGHIVHQGGGMCRGQLERGCRRLLAKDWTAPAA